MSTDNSYVDSAWEAGTLNPYALLRRRTGMSYRDFAKQYNFSNQTIVLIEQGAYADLSDRQILALGRACHEKGIDAKAELLAAFGVPTLSEAYQNWQKAERFSLQFKLAKIKPKVGTPVVSPGFQFVKDVTGSLQGFAKLLKVQPATVARWSNGVQAGMPRKLREALEDAQYPYIELLSELHEKWWEKNHARS